MAYFSYVATDVNGAKVKGKEYAEDYGRDNNDEIFHSFTSCAKSSQLRFPACR